MKAPKIIFPALATISLLAFSACSQQEEPAAGQKATKVAKQRSKKKKSQRKKLGKMQLSIANKELPVKWEKNKSVDELKRLTPLTIKMSMYGGFEQVGHLNKSIISDDRQTKTIPGDIVLYSSNQIVVFYGSNSWAYTKLGHINLGKKELRKLLSHGSVKLTLK